jgi:hypothetical protein
VIDGIAKIEIERYNVLASTLPERVSEGLPDAKIGRMMEYTNVFR